MPASIFLINRFIKTMLTNGNRYFVLPIIPIFVITNTIGAINL